MPCLQEERQRAGPVRALLIARWNEGCRNGKRLYREIREQGYANSEEICARFTAQLRRAEASGRSPSSVPRARRGAVAGLSPTSKNVAALFMRREGKLSEEQTLEGFVHKLKLLKRQSPRLLARSPRINTIHHRSRRT